MGKIPLLSVNMCIPEGGVIHGTVSSGGQWHDVFLMWDPEDYDNITDTRLPWDKVAWTTSYPVTCKFFGYQSSRPR
jgi:hypothetical protein